MTIEISELAKLEVKPGDVLLIKVPKGIDMRAVQQLGQSFKGRKIKTVLYSDDLVFKVVTKVEADKATEGKEEKEVPSAD